MTVKGSPLLEDYVDSLDETNTTDVLTKKSTKILEGEEGLFSGIWSKVKAFVDDLIGSSDSPQTPTNSTNATSTTIAPKTIEPSIDATSDDEEIVKPKPTTPEPDEEPEEDEEESEEER